MRRRTRISSPDAGSASGGGGISPAALKAVKGCENVWKKSGKTSPDMKGSRPVLYLRPGRTDKYGHLSVVLNNPRKTWLVHQLVMLAFVGEPPEGMYVLHSNGNPSDNRLSNLRYDTQSENVLDVYRQGKAWKKLTAEDVGGIRFGLSCGISCTELGQMFGVGHQAISKIKNGERYQWLK